MPASHLKRKIAPKTWPILRKTRTFITRPKPKGQKMALTLPVVVALRDVLGLVESAPQARKVLRSTEIKVNGTRVYDVDAAVGFLDVFDVAGTKRRLVLNRNNILEFAPVAKGEEFALEKVTGITTLKGNKAQVNCAGGRTAIVEKGAFKPGDSVQVSLDGKLGERYPLASGATVLVTAGAHIGAVGTVDKVEGKELTITADGATFTTRVTHVYVIGKDKPAISLNKKA